MGTKVDPGAIRVGSAAYRFDHGQIKFLLVTEQPKAKHWILPAGHQQPGETLQQTAYRETLEESGCKIKVQGQLGSFSTFSHGQECATLIFLARCISMDCSVESRNITWKTIDEVGKLSVFPESFFLLEKAQRILTNQIQEAERSAHSLLGKIVPLTINRPIGTKHAGIRYTKNYGYIEGVVGKDGDFLDGYLLGVDHPLQSFNGKCIGIIKRTNDFDDKLIVVPPNMTCDPETIRKETYFVEQFFKSELILM